MPDVYQATTDVLSDVANNPRCYGVFGPLFSLFGDCTPPQTETIAPVVVTPAAPRSVAEMTSGLWTPQEAFRLTQEKLLQAKQQQQAVYAASVGKGNYYSDTPPASNDMSTSDWLVVGGLVIAGLVVIKTIVR